MKFLFTALMLLIVATASAQVMTTPEKYAEFISLYPPGRMPNSKGLKLRDSIANERIYQVGNPGMYAFFSSATENKGAAVVICPGGGYERLAYVISGTQLAKWFNTIGVSAFVLNYRLPNSPDLQEREKAPLQDLQRAIKLIRKNAAIWGIKPNRIGVQGSSAGGHLAGLVAVTNEDYSRINDEIDTFSFRPDFTILISPVVDMHEYAHAGSKKNLLGSAPTVRQLEKFSNQLNVSSTMPPAFIVHAFDDKAVSVKNSLLLADAMVSKKVSVSLHLFPQGGHAIALRNNPGSTQQWPALCEAWLQEMGFIN